MPQANESTALGRKRKAMELADYERWGAPPPFYFAPVSDAEAVRLMTEANAEDRMVDEDQIPAPPDDDTLF